MNNAFYDMQVWHDEDTNNLYLTVTNTTLSGGVINIVETKMYLVPSDVKELLSTIYDAYPELKNV